MGQDSSKASQPPATGSSGRRIELKPLYTIRILVKGEKNVGKTSLIRMLQGQPFQDAYSPSESTQAHVLDWQFKDLTEKVRVELWDCVEQTLGQRPVSNELKLSFDPPSPSRSSPEVTTPQPEGTHALWLVYDPRKDWTYQYVKGQLAAAEGLPVLVLANYRDCAAKWTVQTAVARSELTALHPALHVIECSAKNGFGRSPLFSSLNGPFLDLQRAHLQVFASLPPPLQFFH